MMVRNKLLTIFGGLKAEVIQNKIVGYEKA